MIIHHINAVLRIMSVFVSVLVWLVLCDVDSTAWGQTSKGRSAPGLSKGKTGEGKAGKGSQQGDGLSKGGGGGSDLVLSRPVLPEHYVLGPGDNLTINRWGEDDSFESVTVSAEGKISLPVIGELHVKGLTLAQAEELLAVEVKKYYRNVRSGIALNSLRSFMVGVLGAVGAPGPYPATLDSRVSDLVAKAGGALPSGSLRRIRLTQSGKLRAMSDLHAYRRRGDEGANSYVHEGDVIFVPPLSGSLVKVFDAALLTTSSTGEEGAEASAPQPSAPQPLMYELEEGQTFSRLVFDLGGMNPAWDLTHVYVVRDSPGGHAKQKIQVELEKMMIHQDSTKDLVLRKGDTVYFAAASEWPYLNARGELIGAEIPYHQYLYENKQDGAVLPIQREAASDHVQSLPEVAVNLQTDRQTDRPAHLEPLAPADQPVNEGPPSVQDSMSLQQEMLGMLSQFMGEIDAAVGDLKASVKGLAKETASLRATVAEGNQFRSQQVKEQEATLKAKLESLQRLRQDVRESRESKDRPQ